MRGSNVYYSYDYIEIINANNKESRRNGTLTRLYGEVEEGWGINAEEKKRRKRTKLPSWFYQAQK